MQDRRSVRITYIGHATLLLEIGGARFLTDPNYDPRLGRFLRRVSEPGIPIGDLPPLDAILVTHAHADHLSFTTLDALSRAVPLYAPPPIATWLRKLGYANSIGIPPGERIELAPGLRLHTAAARHSGARYGFDSWRGAAQMYLLENESLSCFFAGDTALTPETHRFVTDELGSRRLDVALLPIGHAPWWKRESFRKGHLTADDALTLFERLRARIFIPYHWGTFNHVTSGAHDAIRHLRATLPRHPRQHDVRILEPGTVFDLVQNGE